MFHDLRLAFQALLYPASWWSLLLALTLTILLAGGMAYGVWALLGYLNFTESSRLESALGILGGIGTFIAFLFVFPSLVSVVMGVFSDYVADRIERDHYPFLPEGKAPMIIPPLKIAAGSFMRVVSLNVLLFPLYFIPGLNLLIYFIVNGKIISREVYLSLAIRYVSYEQALESYRANRWYFFRQGLVIALLYLIPVVNLFSPIIAISFIMHRVLRENSSPLRVALALSPESVLVNSQGAARQDD